jgi:hypothetical protein
VFDVCLLCLVINVMLIFVIELLKGEFVRFYVDKFSVKTSLYCKPKLGH